MQSYNNDLLIRSDDDEFYDRVKKKMPKQKCDENQSIETADSLLDKKNAIIKEMEDKKKLLLNEKGKVVIENEAIAECEAGDALDAYMSGLSYYVAFLFGFTFSIFDSTMMYLCYIMNKFLFLGLSSKGCIAMDVLNSWRVFCKL